MKNRMFFLLMILFSVSSYASQYLHIESEQDLPRVSNNIRHFLDNESDVIKKIQGNSDDFSKENCEQLARGKSFLMADFRSNPYEFKIQLRNALKYVVNNQRVILEKIDNKDIDPDFVYGLWFLNSAISQLNV